MASCTVSTHATLLLVCTAALPMGVASRASAALLAVLSGTCAAAGGHNCSELSDVSALLGTQGQLRWSADVESGGAEEPLSVREL